MDETDKRVSKDDKEPYYDAKSRIWKVVTEYGKEEGDVIFVLLHSNIGGKLLNPRHSPCKIGRFKAKRSKSKL